MRKDRKHNLCFGHCFWSFFFFELSKIVAVDCLSLSSVYQIFAEVFLNIWNSHIFKQMVGKENFRLQYTWSHYDFFFFARRYNPWWVLACFTISFHELQPINCDFLCDRCPNLMFSMSSHNFFCNHSGIFLWASQRYHYSRMRSASYPLSNLEDQGLISECASLGTLAKPEEFPLPPRCGTLSPLPRLSSLGYPTSSYATATIASFSGTRSPPFRFNLNLWKAEIKVKKILYIYRRRRHETTSLTVYYVY
jgi:hypothetical protein